MITVFLAVFLGVVGFIVGRSQFGVGSGVFLALLGSVASYILIARRMGKKVEVIMKQVEEHLGAQRAEKALGLLESLAPLRRWQPMLGAWVDAQIGVIHYSTGRREEAKPYLEKAPAKMWQAKAMLGAQLFRTKQYDEMVKVFDHATTKNKKTALLWATYSWCEWKRGRRDQAISALTRARQALPDDVRLQKSLEALQNLKKPKMRAYGNEWLSLGLEDGPGVMVMEQAGGGRAMPPWARRAFGGRATKRPRA